MKNMSSTQKPSPSDVFKERLRAAREMRGLSQADLATKTGLPPSSIAHFEGGKRKPSFDNLRKLSEALDVTTDYLLGRADDPTAAVTADPLFRHAAKLTDKDRALAAEFLEMLAKRGGRKEE
ncbi:helix-turn-helix domain-containing protein [Desulfocurvibacter africanus]|uniref:helix-turn-helix domain-containing protein n=1 Tax=Desulfocurvibacter africanus TaxID=873 RepID=UPI001B7FBF16|nr:helix-turn-helix transcriptional regulator [Desulfocurvibacter africanus]